MIQVHTITSDENKLSSQRLKTSAKQIVSRKWGCLETALNVSQAKCSTLSKVPLK
jgi:hypothetical protein